MIWGLLLKYKIKFTSRFKKDLKLAKKQGKNIDKLFEVIEKLANDEILDENIKITNWLETIKERENAISSQIFFLSMRNLKRFLYYH